MFEIDKQTLKDLSVLPLSSGGDSLVSIFREVSSYGGKYQLERMFEYPLSSTRDIRDRVEMIRYLEAGGCQLEIDREILDFIEHYYSQTTIPSRYSFIDGLRKNWGARLVPNNAYYIVCRGVEWLTELLQGLYTFVCEANPEGCPELFVLLREKVTGVLESDDLAPILRHEGSGFSIGEIERFDHVLRYLWRDDCRQLLEIIYTIDAFQAVIRVKQKRGWVFAEVREDLCLHIEGLWHPFLKDPVRNDFSLDGETNTGFLTGANMAGKSTYMKAVSLAVYLAHLGFPVPAVKMEFSVFAGMFTSINVPDELSLGYSHFYSEVKRIRYVAEKVSSGRRYLIVFDELFRGTNVKDAYEATLAVITAFARKRSCIFLFSSHLIEVAEELKGKVPGIWFGCFPTELRGDALLYPYRLTEGVSDDRFGMYILRREGIEELLQVQPEEEALPDQKGSERNESCG